MPKNAHPPRGGGDSSKKKKPAGPPANSSNADDGSYIVFSNSKGDPKKGKRSDAPAQESAENKLKGKGKTTAAAETEAEAPKKPDTRTLIGGASWTGKLPVNMLSEHCQKQKWDKPEYTMNRAPQGFHASVILRNTNPKTKEATTLPAMRVPREHEAIQFQPSAVEARHFAAAFALFRVANMRNLHMMMPPMYKDLWKGAFEDIKKEAESAGTLWMFEADPFAAFREHEERKAAGARSRKERERMQEKQRAQQEALGFTPGTAQVDAPRPRRGWARAPKIDMGKNTRREIERLLRMKSIWNPAGVRLDGTAKKSIVEEISQYGFRRSHVEEAVEICKDREEVLEWLLIHVPEDDLPGWSLPEGYFAGVSMASGNLKREAAVKRLALGGYATELCEEALDGQDGDEGRAAGVLQARLLGDAAYSSDVSDDMSRIILSDDPADTWTEEVEVLRSIFDDRYKAMSGGQFQVKLEVGERIGKPVSLVIRRPAGPYPRVLPVLTVQAELPAYIRLIITRRALEHARENFLGDQMVFNIIDWVEQEAPGLVERPGRLAEVSSAISGGDAGIRADDARRSHGRRKKPRPIEWRPGSAKSDAIFDAWSKRQDVPRQREMLKVRQGLPAWKLRDEIVRAVGEHQVVIVSGETGSGKSTQSVQFILDDLIRRRLGDAANIVCTQPRRISALGLADRVADERCGAAGDEVGYSIRGDSKGRPGTTKITFVTTGVLLRRMQTAGGTADDVVDSLADVSHVVVDEVHERSLDTDFLLVLLRDVLKRRRDLKLILMSATLDADVFEGYFASVGPVGRIEIEGRTHPVQDVYLDDVVRATGFNGYFEDEGYPDDEAQRKGMGGALQGLGMGINYDLIAATVRQIDAELGPSDRGGILIFLPGTMEIDRTLQALRAVPRLHALPLHASLTPMEQRRVFPPAPGHLRKVVAATNVAETSITISDVVAVIDTGRVKETAYDPAAGATRLSLAWASRAACKQRRGRAGRVRPGICYKLYTRSLEATRMAERPEPEMRRVPLEQLCLSVAAMGVRDVRGFLAGAPSPPESAAVSGALSLLRSMGAVDTATTTGADDGAATLTSLGAHLASIPADLRAGKLLVLGSALGCLEPSLTMAAVLSCSRPPFVAPQGKRDEARAARNAFAAGDGDLLGDLRAFEGWTRLRAEGCSYREVKAWCDANFLAPNALADVASNRAQLLAALQEAGFAPLDYDLGGRGKPRGAEEARRRLNRNAHHAPLLRALVAAAVAPQIARAQLPDAKFAQAAAGAVPLDPEARGVKYFVRARRDVDPSATAATAADARGGGGGGGGGGIDTRVFLHPSSTLFAPDAPDGHAAAPRTTAPFLAYFSLAHTSKPFLRDVTPLDGYAALLFGGPVAVVPYFHAPAGKGAGGAGRRAGSEGGGMVLVDDWLVLRGWARVGALVSRLRAALDGMLAGVMERPGGWGGDGGGGGEARGREAYEDAVVALVRKLVELGGLDN